MRRACSRTADLWRTCQPVALNPSRRNDTLVRVPSTAFYGPTASAKPKGLRNQLAANAADLRRGATARLAAVRRFASWNPNESIQTHLNAAECEFRPSRVANNNREDKARRRVALLATPSQLASERASVASRLNSLVLPEFKGDRIGMKPSVRPSSAQLARSRRVCEVRAAVARASRCALEPRRQARPVGQRAVSRQRGGRAVAAN